MFTRNLECWRDDYLLVFHGRPFIIAEDEQREKKYKLGSIVCLLTETVLGASIAYGNRLPLWSGAFIALTFAVIFNAAFLLAFGYAVSKPRNALYKVRRYFLHPSLFIIGFALPAFLLGRMVRGEMAVIIAPIVSLALWVATIALVVLSASLLTTAYIYGWTQRYKKSFDRAFEKQMSLKVDMDKTLRELSVIGVDVDPLINQLNQKLQSRNLSDNELSLYVTNSNQATSVMEIKLLSRQEKVS